MAIPSELQDKFNADGDSGGGDPFKISAAQTGLEKLAETVRNIAKASEEGDESMTKYAETLFLNAKQTGNVKEAVKRANEILQTQEKLQRQQMTTVKGLWTESKRLVSVLDKQLSSTRKEIDLLKQKGTHTDEQKQKLKELISLETKLGKKRAEKQVEQVTAFSDHPAMKKARKGFENMGKQAQTAVRDTSDSAINIVRGATSLSGIADSAAAGSKKMMGTAIDMSTKFVAMATKGIGSAIKFIGNFLTPIGKVVTVVLAGVVSGIGTVISGVLKGLGALAGAILSAATIGFKLLLKWAGIFVDIHRSASDMAGLMGEGSTKGFQLGPAAMASGGKGETLTLPTEIIQGWAQKFMEQGVGPGFIEGGKKAIANAVQTARFLAIKNYEAYWGRLGRMTGKTFKAITAEIGNTVNFMRKNLSKALKQGAGGWHKIANAVMEATDANLENIVSLGEMTRVAMNLVEAGDDLKAFGIDLAKDLGPALKELGGIQRKWGLGMKAFIGMQSGAKNAWEGITKTMLGSTDLVKNAQGQISVAGGTVSKEDRMKQNVGSLIKIADNMTKSMDANKAFVYRLQYFQSKVGGGFSEKVATMLATQMSGIFDDDKGMDALLLDKKDADEIRKDIAESNRDLVKKSERGFLLQRIMLRIQTHLFSMLTSVLNIIVLWLTKTYLWISSKTGKIAEERTRVTNVLLEHASKNLADSSTALVSNLKQAMVVSGVGKETMTAASAAMATASATGRFMKDIMEGNKRIATDVEKSYQNIAKNMRDSEKVDQSNRALINYLLPESSKFKTFEGTAGDTEEARISKKNYYDKTKDKYSSKHLGGPIPSFHSGGGFTALNNEVIDLGNNLQKGEVNVSGDLAGGQVYTADQIGGKGDVHVHVETLFLNEENIKQLQEAMARFV